jgi:acetyl esterase/lipase
MKKRKTFLNRCIRVIPQTLAFAISVLALMNQASAQATPHVTQGGVNPSSGKFSYAPYDPSAHYELKVFEVPLRINSAGRQLMARVYQPVLPKMIEGRETPVILDLHGGAWNAKDRTAEEPMDRSIAASGVLVVAIDLTLAPEAPYPANVQDASYGVRWLKLNAPKWGGNAEYLGIYASSSGGHVAELLSMRPSDPRYNAYSVPGGLAVDTSIAYVIARSPISNPFDRYQNALKLNRERMIRNHTQYFQPWESIHESNPVEILERGEPVHLVPMLVMQGALDDNVLPEIQERFVRAYIARGGHCEYELFPDSVHEWVAQEGVQTNRARVSVKAFIAKQLGALKN